MPPSVAFYKEDIRNRLPVSDIVKHEGANACIHLAAKISVVDSIRDPFETIDVNVNGTGQQTRDFIHVTDVVRGAILAANSEVSGVFNIGTGKPTSIDHLAQEMIRIYGLDVEPIYSAAIKGDILHSCANTKKSEKGLRFVAHQDVETALRMSIGQRGLVAT